MIYYKPNQQHAKGRFASTGIASGLCATLLLLPAATWAQGSATSPGYTPKPEVQALLDDAARERGQGHFADAIRLYTDARSKAQTLNDGAGEANARLGASNTHLAAKEYDKALIAYTEAFQLKSKIGDRAGAARVQIGLGNVHQATGHSDKALPIYTEALTTLRGFSDRDGLVGQARALTGIGLACQDMGSDAKAVASLDEAIRLFRSAGDGTGEIAALTDLGGVYVRQKLYAKAIPILEQSTTLLRQQNSQTNLGESLNNLGAAYNGAGQQKKAADTYSQLVTLRHDQNNGLAEANALISLAGVYEKDGNVDQAVGTYDRAIAAYHTLADARHEADAQASCGRVYLNGNSPRQSLPRLDQALALFQTLHDNEGVAIVQIYQGDAYQQVNEGEKATRAYDAALAIFVQMGNKPGQVAAKTGKASVVAASGDLEQAFSLCNESVKLGVGLPVEASTYLNLGNAALALDNGDTALKAYRRAELLYRNEIDERGMALAQAGMGNVYLISEEPAKAIPFYEKASPTFDTLHDKSGRATTLRGLGSAYALVGQYEKAIASFESALPLFQQMHNRHEEAGVQLSLGTLWLATGAPAKALPPLQAALPILREVGNRQGEANVLTKIAQAEVMQNQLPNAERDLKSAIALTESVRASLGGLTGAKLTFLASAIEPYQQYIYLQMLQNRPEEAFAIVQQTKARALLDMIDGGQAQISNTMTDDERAKEKTYRKRTEVINTAMLREAVLNEAGSKDRFDTLKGELGQAERELLTFTDSLYASHPEIKQKRLATTATLADMGALIPADTALLEYHVLRAGVGKAALDTVALFVVTTDAGKPKVAVYNLPITEAALVKMVDEFRDACRNPNNAYQASGKTLYRTLFAPALPSLTSKTRLIIGPSGAIWDVPFAALVKDDGKFLISEREIDYTYSATALQVATALRNSPNRPKPEGSLFIVANPSFGDVTRFGIDKVAWNKKNDRGIDMFSRGIDMFSRGIDMFSRGIDMFSRAIDMFSRDGNIMALPGTQREADALKKDFPTAVMYTQAQAQESIVKAEAGKYKYVHLASHAFFNSSAPLLSSVLLADPGKNGTEDGLLTARELFNMRLSADMVTLSACNTARGEKRTGEGIVGLTWALFVAGAPTEVLSQWAVDDTSTALLMDGFYKGLAAGQDKGAALRQAALAVQADKSHQHPYYWSPFILIGEWHK